MKLQFKTDDLLKKVEGLIIKDVAARKEHNRKVDIINEKVNAYIDTQKQQRQSEIEKAEAILAKYSDDELRDMFFEKEVVVHKKGWFKEDVYDSYECKDDVVTLEGVDFKVRTERLNLYIELKKDIPTVDVMTDEYYINMHGKLLHKNYNHKVYPYSLTHVPEVIMPSKESETPPSELLKLKNKCLQAKQYDIEDCMLEDKDLTLLEHYRDIVYTPFFNKHRLELYILSGIQHTLWTDIVNIDELS